MKFIITVDTEADHQKSGDNRVSIKNLESLPKFQNLCAKYNFKPTYLVTYEVATDTKTAAYLKTLQDNDKIEVGTHLHPWTTPSGTETDFLSYPSRLGGEELFTKLDVLTSLITKNFGKTPTSYRAGRWGLDGRQVAMLQQLGYIVDCSITPKVSWASDGGPDFRNAQTQPYFISDKNILEEDRNNKLLEVPMTILYSGLFKKDKWLGERLINSLPDNFIKHVLNRLFFRMKWLRIFPNSNSGDWQRIYKSAEINKLPVVMFMIHSSELHQGTSKMSKTQKDVERNFQQLEELLSFFKSKDVESQTLSEFAKEV